MKVLLCFGRKIYRHRRAAFATALGSIALLLFVYRETCPTKLESDQYYPAFKFDLISPETKPPVESASGLFLVVVVNSGPRSVSDFERREVIRKTWAGTGSQALNRGGEHEWRVFFALGKSGNRTQDRENIREASRHNDMLIGDFNDTYIHLVIKTFMSHLWASSLNCSYVLKTDTDVYVRIPRLITWLRDRGTPKRFYGGHVYEHYSVVRDPCSNKWAISSKYFGEQVWPPYCGGAFHVVSSDILPNFIQYTRVLRPSHIDDSYFGLAARYWGVTPVQITGFNAHDYDDIKKFKQSAFSHSEMEAKVAIGHRLEPYWIKRLHEYYIHPQYT